MRSKLSSVQDVGDIIEAQRTKLNLSQADMLLKAGMSQQQIQRIEAGANITVKTLLHLADVLGLEISISSKGEKTAPSLPPGKQQLADYQKQIRLQTKNYVGIREPSTVMRLFGHMLDKDDE